MKHISKIAVIGGTGKSGKYLVKLLLTQGFHLKLLLRNPENFQVKSPLIEVVKGDARAYESVQLLAEGCQAILSMLSQPKGEPTIFSQATKNVIRAMKHFNIEQYIVTAGLNVDTPFDKKALKPKWQPTGCMQTTRTPLAIGNASLKYCAIATSTGHLSDCQ